MRATTTRAVPQWRVISAPAHQEGCWQEGRAVSGCLRLSRRCSDTCPIRGVQLAVESAETTSDQRCTRRTNQSVGTCGLGAHPALRTCQQNSVLRASRQNECCMQAPLLCSQSSLALLLQAPDGLPGRVPSPGTCPQCPKDGNTATKTEIVSVLTRQGCLLSPLCSGLSACQGQCQKMKRHPDQREEMTPSLLQTA